jgi:hypothetical protein
VLKNGFLVTGTQQLQENISLHNCELAFIVFLIGFVVKEYSMRNNKIEENSGDILLINFW